MGKEDYKFIVCDVPDKEELVCQIFVKNEFWVEVSAETYNTFEVDFYQNKNRKSWNFPFDETVKALQKAKSILSEKQRTPQQKKRYDEQMEKLENWNPTPEETAEYEGQMKEQWEKYYG